MTWFWIALAGEPEREVIVPVQHPGIAGFAGEECELTDRDDTPIVRGGATLDIADLIGKTEAGTIEQALAGTAVA